MRGSLPPRYWRKVVAAIQGVVLTVAMGDALPGPLTTVVLLASLALLVESFGRDVAWLWTTRHLRHTVIHDTPGAMVHAISPVSHSAPSTATALGSGRPDGLPWADRPTVAVARRGIARV